MIQNGNVNKSSNLSAYRVKVDEYKSYWRNGYLIVRNLVTQADVDVMKQFATGLLHGEIEIPGVPPPASQQPQDLYSRFSRIHMLHRQFEVPERYLLYPSVLDVLQALIGPDVMALQTMLFLNPPGRGGQGWHQDAYYITTYPETLIGVWIALDAADEANGCLYVTPGSHTEPIYPTLGRDHLYAEESFEDLGLVEQVSSLDDEANTLTKVARRYPDPIPCIVEPGDVIFFHSHLLHRSYPNHTRDRMRRSFVSHYCNARSWVPWNHGNSWEGASANYLHILARGRTHLDYAQPKFGTPCAAVEAQADSTSEASERMMGMENGDMVFVS
ncbi:MAG: phytanoyl-CoA dioxygenase family protein [Caldilineaceae bacterium]